MPPGTLSRLAAAALLGLGLGLIAVSLLAVLGLSPLSVDWPPAALLALGLALIGSALALRHYPRPPPPGA